MIEVAAQQHGNEPLDRRRVSFSACAQRLHGLLIGRVSDDAAHRSVGQGTSSVGKSTPSEMSDASTRN